MANPALSLAVSYGSMFAAGMCMMGYAYSRDRWSLFFALLNLSLGGLNAYFIMQALNHA